MATPIKAVYWNPDSPVPDSTIRPSLFTHVYYAFVQPDPTTFKLIIDQAKILEFFKFLQPLNPPVKTLLSIGGANNNLGVFAKMASTNQNRQALISSSIATAREHNFDGVELDWEFPRSAVEMTNLGLLYKLWSEALDQEAIESRKTRLLLTSAVYYASAVDIDGDGSLRAYPAIAGYVDWFNLMCYDYNIREAHPYPPAALHSPDGNRNSEDGINSWIEAGVPPSKLVMGMPLYGRSWTLHKPANNGTEAAAVAYRGILEWNKNNNAKVEHDDQIVSCHSKWGTIQTEYDDERCVEAKVKFANKEKNLAGYFFRALGQDTKDWSLSHKASLTWN